MAQVIVLDISDIHVDLDAPVTTYDIAASLIREITKRGMVTSCDQPSIINANIVPIVFDYSLFSFWGDVFVRMLRFKLVGNNLIVKLILAWDVEQ